MLLNIITCLVTDIYLYLEVSGGRQQAIRWTGRGGGECYDYNSVHVYTLVREADNQIQPLVGMRCTSILVMSISN